MGRSQQLPLAREIPVRSTPGDTGHQRGLIHRGRCPGRDELACGSNQGFKGAVLLTGAPDVCIRS